MVDYAAIFGEALMTLASPQILFLVTVGTLVGLIFGSLPGLTATMGVALFIPLTYTMPAAHALAMMIGCFIGGIAGGAVSAILLHIPGTPAAVCTVLDGHPLARQGRGAEALGWAAFSSGWGSIISWLILITMAPVLAGVCVSFSSPEYAALALFGLTIIAAVSGDSVAKGLLAGLIGLFISCVGLDPVYGSTRFTFRNINLLSGIDTLPAIIGFFSLPEILKSCTGKGNPQPMGLTIKNFVPSVGKQFRHLVNIIRSSIIGTFVGIIPATGSGIAAYIAYDQAKRFSGDPDSFGKGNVDGVIAAEAANNGVCGGALIPMLTLGIPGDSVTAVMMGGLMIHGYAPGPALFAKNPDIIGAIFTCVLLASILMVVLQLVGIRMFVKILSVPVSYLSAILVVLSLIGCFALRNNFFDVTVGMALGGLGYLMVRGGFPIAPAVLGLVLGRMFESEIRRSLQVSQGDLLIFFSRPVSLAVILVSAAVIAAAFIKNIRKARAKKLLRGSA